MKHLKLILTLGLVSSVGTMFAQTKVVVNTNDGKTVSIPVTAISDIKFSENGMVISSTEGTETFPLTNIADITFDVKVTSTEDQFASIDEISIMVSNGVLTASTEGSLTLQVFDINGCAIATLKGDAQLSFDMKNLSNGVYVVRVNNKTIKVTR